jgi:hypothetical protein
LRFDLRVSPFVRAWDASERLSTLEGDCSRARPTFVFWVEETPLSMNTRDWRLAYVLPNLQLERSIEFTGVAFVPHNDERLAQIRTSNDASRSLLDGFRDIGGTPLKPAAAIYRFPSGIPTLWDAVADARNCLALSCVLNGWKISIGQLNNFLIRDSDYFDFYRRWPSENGKSFCYQGPALETVSPVPKSFTGQPYPYILPSAPVFSRPEPDERIFRALQRVWLRVHISKKARPVDYRRLRSLSVAYEACRVPHAMDNAIYDHGKHCSFWIAALETLAHRALVVAVCQRYCNSWDTGRSGTAAFETEGALSLIKRPTSDMSGFCR